MSEPGGTLDSFLAGQQAEGKHDSEGVFTVDLAEAAERLVTFRLPSEHHYLLKLVQLATRIGAPILRIKMESFRTSLYFRARSLHGLGQSRALAQAFLSPLEVSDPALSDLVSALWGALGESTLEVGWTVSQGYKGRHVLLKDHKFRVEEFQIETPLSGDELPCAFTFSVVRRKTWRFWTHSRRNADAYRLLVTHCSLSRTELIVDGRPLQKAEGSFFTAHRRFSRYGEPARATPYHTAYYRLDSSPGSGLKMGRPTLAQYVVRNHHFNLWVSGLRTNNSLLPDGISSPAWMLQFRDPAGDDLSLREVGKIVRCRFLLAFDEQAANNKEELRLTLVRQSVLLQRAAPQAPVFDPEPWYGCHLVLDDDTLGTDLTGFQIIEDQRLADLLKSLEPEVKAAKAYFAQGRTLVYGIGSTEATPPSPPKVEFRYR